MEQAEVTRKLVEILRLIVEDETPKSRLLAEIDLLEMYMNVGNEE